MPIWPFKGKKKKKKKKKPNRVKNAFDRRRSAMKDAMKDY
jgi:hypothetical protein